MSACAILVLAAGQGTRMRSDLPKVLHTLGGRSLIAHVLDTARKLNPSSLVVVTGHQSEKIQTVLHSPDITWINQEEQLGTAHAVGCALPALEGLTGQLIILNGDTPLVDVHSLESLLAQHRRERVGVTLISTHISPPTGYGRVVRDPAGRLMRVVEDKDANQQEKTIQEINSGVYCIELEHLKVWLEQISNNNVQGEYYLPDIVPIALAHQGAGAYYHEDALSLMGINTRKQLADMEVTLRDRVVLRLMDQGVTFVDPSSCWVALDAVIGRDTSILPNVILGPETHIGQGCQIGPFCQISRSRIGSNCEIKGFCHLEGAEVEGENIIGPYARLRPGTVLATKARVGNFCEIKKSHIGEGSKVNHLSYIGDTTMGCGVNVGAGTITCNYDGQRKHQTVIGDHVFIGSDTQFVAPVVVGSGVVIAAGTTITKAVPEDALALSRSPQKHIQDWSKRTNKQEK